MKKIIIGLISISTSGAVFANTTVNTSTSTPVYIGASIAEGSFNNQYSLSNNGNTLAGNRNNGTTKANFHLGWQHQAFRAELDIDYLMSQRVYSIYDSVVKQNLLKTTPSSAVDTMLEGYYDLKLNHEFSTFAGIGVGYLHTFASGTSASQQSGQTAAANNLAYNAKLGMDYRLTSDVDTYASAELLRLAGNDTYMNSKDYFTTFSIGLNYTI